MKLVIDIDDNLYTRLFDNGVDNYDDAVDMAKSIRKGTPLPKNHGRLIDENNLWFEDIDDISCVTQRNVENAPTIIEADKETKEDTDQKSLEEWTVGEEKAGKRGRRMSGGAFDYMYGRIEETYVGEMQDADLDEMMKDLCVVLHDLEWWQSCDTSEESYRKSEKAFKQKWLRGYDWETDDRIERAKRHIKEFIEKEFDKI